MNKKHNVLVNRELEGKSESPGSFKLNCQSNEMFSKEFMENTVGLWLPKNGSGKSLKNLHMWKTKKSD